MKSVEQEYIALFREYYQQVWNSMISFESPQFYRYTVELTKKFRKICTTIGKDPRFLGMETFLNVVRDADREAVEYAGKVKRRFEGHPERQPAENPADDKFTPLLNRFYYKVDQIHPSSSQNPAFIPKSLRPALEQAQATIRQLLGLEFSAEDQTKIDTYRASLTAEKQQLIKKPLNIKEEMKVFRIYSVDVLKTFNHYEHMGWFNSIKNYAPVWLKYLDKIREKRQGTDYLEYDILVKQTYINFQQWIGRVETKYKAKMDLELEGMDLINSDMREKILSYKQIRRAFIRFEENKRILKIVK